jgi:phospholipase/lecithinase/hemolysin
MPLSRWSTLASSSSPFWLEAVEDWLRPRLFTGFGPLLPRLTGPVVREGTAGNDFLAGSLGNDVLRGGPGDDVLLGLGGNNQLFGGEGNDLLVGGGGRDRLDGGPGQNWLIGGPGADRFVLRADGRFDTIFDFQVGVDRLLLEGGLTRSQLVISQQGPDAQIRYLGQPDPSVLLLNVDASQLQADSFLTSALVPTFDSLVIFGDSLSDSGNLFQLTGVFPPPPYSQGRFTNGDIWVDYLAESLDLDPSRIQNFALGGATTGRSNVFSQLLSDLTGVPVTLPGLLDQVDSYGTALGGAGADPNGLYVVWAGANDLFNLPSNPEAVPGFVANSVQNIADTIVTLAGLGAESFLVPNLPNLGLTPRSLIAGVSEEATFLSQSFNTGLADALDGLSLALNIDVVSIDLFARTTEIIQRPEEFGFTNVTDPLIEQGLFTQDPGFFWWDRPHPTTQVHELLAGAFQATLFEAGYLSPAPEDLSQPVLGAAPSPLFPDLGDLDQVLASSGLEERVNPLVQRVLALAAPLG